MSEKAELIKQHLGKLAHEFARYKVRWDGLEKQINTVHKTAGEINTTNKKITNRFHEIEKDKVIDAEQEDVIEQNEREESLLIGENVD